MLTRLLRNRRTDGEAGAAAMVLVVGVASGVLFGLGAMAVDLGNAYARKRATRTAADLVALAGAQGLPDMVKARTMALNYLGKNPVQGGVDYGSLPPGWDDNEVTPSGAAGAAAFTAVGATDGEIDFYGLDHVSNQWVPASASIPATRIRVVVPPRTVEFGIGQAVGFSNVAVRSAATVEIRSPGAFGETPPFYLTGADGGMTCIKDDSPGGGPSVMRSALLFVPPTLTSISPTPILTTDLPRSEVVTGTGFANAANNNQVVLSQGATVLAPIAVSAKTATTVTFAAPTLPAGNWKVVVQTKSGNTWTDSTNSTTLVVNNPPPTPTPTIATMNPNSGPEYTATAFTLTGANYDPSPGKTTVTFGPVNLTVNSVTTTQITTSTPATLPAGTYSVQVSVTGPGGTATSTAKTFTLTPLPAPSVISITPVLGPDTGGTAVTITGTGFLTGTPKSVVNWNGVDVSATIVSATKITLSSPPGTAGMTVPVFVRNGSSPSNSVLFTYVADPSSCAGTASNRGYIDEPRYDVGGANPALTKNIKFGIDHTILSYTGTDVAIPYGQHAAPATGDQCDGVADSFYSGANTPANPINCIRLKTGAISSFEAAFFGSPDGRMYHPNPNFTPGTVHGYSPVDVTRLQDYINSTGSCAGTLDAIRLNQAASAVREGCLSPKIFKSPRFAILPILNAPITPPTGVHYYWCVGFKALFIDKDDADTSASETGFTWNGGSMRIIKGYVFDPKYLPGTVSSTQVGGTQDYTGSGPKIPLLVHDTGDGTY